MASWFSIFLNSWSCWAVILLVASSRSFLFSRIILIFSMSCSLETPSTLWSSCLAMATGLVAAAGFFEVSLWVFMWLVNLASPMMLLSQISQVYDLMSCLLCLCFLRFPFELVISPQTLHTKEDGVLVLCMIWNQRIIKSAHPKANHFFVTNNWKWSIKGCNSIIFNNDQNEKKLFSIRYEWDTSHFSTSAKFTARPLKLNQAIGAKCDEFSKC